MKDTIRTLKIQQRGSLAAMKVDTAISMAADPRYWSFVSIKGGCRSRERVVLLYPLGLSQQQPRP